MPVWQLHIVGKGIIMRGLMRRAPALVVALVRAACLAPPGQAAEVDDAKLESFILAAISAHDVIKSAADRINQAGSDAEISQLRDEIDAQVEQAIEQTDGITLAEYREIHEAARADPALENRIIEKFNA